MLKHPFGSPAILVFFFITVIVGSAKEFLWNGGGVISVDVPEEWSVLGKDYGEKSYTFLVTPKSGNKAEMTLSLVQHARKQGDAAIELSKRLEQAVTPLLKYTAEKQFAAESLKMRQGFGLMSQLTGDDLRGKLPIKINHKVLRMAFCSIDENCTLVAFMQTDATDSQEAADMMSLLTSTTLRRLGQSAILEVTTKNDCYVLTVPIGKLGLVIPKGGLVQAPANVALTGATASPRYFYFIDAQRRLQLSGWFENEKGYDGIEKFWQSENKGNRLNAKHVSIEKCGNWDVVFYEFKPIGGVVANTLSSNLRAEYAHDGTWIDLHCSIISAAPGTGDKETLFAFVRSLKIELVGNPATTTEAPKLSN